MQCYTRASGASDVEMVANVSVERERPGTVQITLIHPSGGRVIHRLTASPAQLAFPPVLEQIAFLWLKDQMRLLA